MQYLNISWHGWILYDQPLIIDVFNHCYPKEYLDAIPKPLPDSISRVASTMKGITDLQYRLKFMNRHGVGTQPFLCQFQPQMTSAFLAMN